MLLSDGICEDRFRMLLPDNSMSEWGTRNELFSKNRDNIGLELYQDYLIDKYVALGFKLQMWHVVNGVKKPRYVGWVNARYTPDQVKAWCLEGTKTGGIGYIPGRSGMIVVDVDTSKVPKWVSDLRYATLSSLTYRGFHLHFRNSGEKLSGREFPGVEVYGLEGDVQWVALPGSLHPKGFRYRLVGDRASPAPFSVFLKAAISNGWIKSLSGDKS